MKSWAKNLLMWSDLTLGSSFKVKQWLIGFGELSFWWIQFASVLGYSIVISYLSGCKLLGMTMNRFMYTNDMTLIAPSSKDLQPLLHTGENYAIKHEVIFNAVKSMCMCKVY